MTTERVARYEKNLDEWLTLTPIGEHLSELQTERLRWIRRYEEFVERLDAGGRPHWGEHVNDYVLVIALLGSHIDKLRKEAAANAEAANDD